MAAPAEPRLFVCAQLDRAVAQLPDLLLVPAALTLEPDRSEPLVDVRVIGLDLAGRDQHGVEHRVDAEAVLDLEVIGVASVVDERAQVCDELVGSCHELGAFGECCFVAGEDGGGEQLVDISELNEDWGRALWSHDGPQLLMSNIIRFDQQGELLPFRPATARPDGSEFNLLDLPEFPFDMYCSAWSLDDQRILCAVASESPGMWSMAAADGSDPVQLTTNPDGLIDQAIGYSPDGTEIAFLRFRPDGAVALLVVNADGTDPRQITEFGALLGHELASAAWSPDGEQLISATATGVLIEVRSDGSGTHAIDLDVGTDDYFAFAPSYSSDGSRIVFSLEVAAAADIYTVDRNGSNVVQITDMEVPERFPSWANTMATE